MNAYINDVFILAQDELTIIAQDDLTILAQDLDLIRLKLLAANSPKTAASRINKVARGIRAVRNSLTRPVQEPMPEVTATNGGGKPASANQPSMF